MAMFCDLLVIGGGVAGMRSALDAARSGSSVALVERKATLGGLSSILVHSSDISGSPAETALRMAEECRREELITIMLDTNIGSVTRREEGFTALVAKGDDPPTEIHAKAIILATGMEPIDATILPEYGYGRFKGVITSLDLERMWSTDEAVMAEAKGVAFVQCVGSRVDKRGVPYCSSYCCANAVKNAILLKRRNPGIGVFVLYIDIRTCGRGEERAYREARRLGVKFIRGQPALIREQGGRLLVCGENTLVNELYELPVDKAVLCVGLRLSDETVRIVRDLGLALDEEGLIHIDRVSSAKAPRVLIAGCAESPKGVIQSIEQASHCATLVVRSLK